MSEAGSVYLVCPHCVRPLTAETGHAGHEVFCPHPDCRRAVAVPFSLNHEDEPDEPVLLPEDPAAPEQVPVAPPGRSANSTPLPKPKPRRERYEEPELRAAVLPWAFAAVAFLLAAGAVMGWAVTATRTDPELAHAVDRAAALEAKNRELRSANQKLRDELDAARTAPAAPAPGEPKRTEPERPAPSTNGGPHVAARPELPPPALPRNEPRPPKRIAENRDAFVGTWSITGPQLRQNGIELAGEFRADGTYVLAVKGGAAGGQELTGRWRWDGRLHIEADNQPNTSKPADVRWNGSDEFVATAAGDRLTFRRTKP